MALVLKDRVKETTTTTGTGSYVLAGAVTGFQSFTNALDNGDTTHYAVENGTDWETGLGTWTESTATLARTTIYESSNSGNAVNWGAGSKDIFITKPASRNSTITVYATVNDLPTTGNQAGDQAYVSGNNRLYLYNGSGWYNIALVNQTPSISGNSASYGLATDGTATVVTLTGTDPEGLPLTWSATTSGDTAIATVTNSANVFTITPVTSGNGGTLTVTFRASDGINIGTSNSSFQLSFGGQQAYTTAGTYSWTCPAGVTSVCVVCVGGGGGGGNGGTSAFITSGAGGGLGYKNNISVTPGSSYTVVVGAGGASSTGSPAGDGGDSYFINATTVKGGGGGGAVHSTGATGGTYVGDGGGNGGDCPSNSSSTACTGAGGAGGYSGDGGDGGIVGVAAVSVGGDGAGGGGGGGGRSGQYDQAGAGGGVGILGEGTSGTGGAYTGNNAGPGTGGSGGDDGDSHTSGQPAHGGAYGGGGAGSEGPPNEQGNGGGGAVRIIWGAGRAFPSTNTADV